MSILDDNYVERTDKLFLLRRWLPSTPQVSKLWTLHYTSGVGSTFNNPVEVDANYANQLCNVMFDGQLTLDELWKLIGGVEVTPDWVDDWNRIALQTHWDDMSKYNEMINGSLVRKIANALMKRFAYMHIMSMNEFDKMHILSSVYRQAGYRNDDWFSYEPGVLLHADWFESPAYIKLMMTSNGIGFGLLYACDVPYNVSNASGIKNKLLTCPYEKQWDYDMFALDLSPEKVLLNNPRDIDTI